MRHPSTTTTIKNTTTTTSSTSSSWSKIYCNRGGMLRRGPWTPDEDEILTRYIEKEGEGKWRTMPKKAGLSRCGKSCRLRWMNYLRPELKRGGIGWDEEDLIVRLHRLLGNRWSLIAGRIPGRTDNEIKNYWNTHISKKLISQGIDPRTHKPLINYTEYHSNTTITHFSRTPPSLKPRPNPENHVPYGNSSRSLLHEDYSSASYVENRRRGDKEVIMRSTDQDASNTISFLPTDNVESSKSIGWSIADHGKFEDLNHQGTFDAAQGRSNDNEIIMSASDIVWGINNEVEVHERFDYGNEDHLSSFLNGLASEDLFMDEQQQHDHHQQPSASTSMPQDSMMSYYFAQIPPAWDSMITPTFGAAAIFPEMHDSR